MEILPEIKNRKSPVVFSEKDVEKEKLNALVEAARLAPSCMNKQPWNYIFIGKSDTKRLEMEDALSFGNGWAKKAPYLVTVSANPKEGCLMNNIEYFLYDAGLSVMNFAIEAEHQGLRTRQMAGWDSIKIKNAIGLPEKHKPIVVIALGYEEDSKKVLESFSEKIRWKIFSSRSRKPANENFFFGVFGKTRE